MFSSMDDLVSQTCSTKSARIIVGPEIIVLFRPLFVDDRSAINI